MPNLLNRILCARYQIISQIGTGGMAEAYRARDLHRNADLAIKALKPELARDQSFIERFREEANALRNLEHPNIVRFYSFEHDKELDVFFIVMDYVEGVTLREEMKAQGGKLNFRRILEILREVCAALDYAHKSGYTHRDIKPSNILIGRGRAYLTDFGIARASRGAFAEPGQGGTPGYMSPEQIRGETPNPASDIYSLGVMLYEMAAGVRPFRGDSPNTTGATSERVKQEHLRMRPPSLRLYNPQIPLQLEEIILQCLRKNASERFRSASELMRALERAIPVRPDSQPAPSVSSNVNPPYAAKNAAKRAPAPSFPRKRLATGLWVAASAAVLIVVFLLAISGGAGTAPLSTAVKTMRPPTVLPSKTSPQTQNFSIRPYNPYTDSNIQDALMLAQFPDLKSPDKVSKRISLPFASSLKVGPGWCATDLTTLEENLRHLEFQIKMDGTDVSLSQLKSEEERQSGLICRRFSGTLSGLRQGEHTYAEILRFKTQIFDGESVYPEGEYIYELKITVK